MYNMIMDNYKSEFIGIHGLYNILNKNQDAFVLLNLFLQYYPEFPNGRDLYILGYTHELFVEDDFLQVYNKNPQAEFILLGDFYFRGVDLLDRVRCVRVCTWHKILDNLNVPGIQWSNRSYKISSLSNYTTESRYFITALLQNKTDCIYSWHNKKRSRGDHEYYHTKTGHPLKDSLINTVLDIKEIDHFQDIYNDSDDINNSSYSVPYSNSLINCINETTEVSRGHTILDLPVPYITEKTWKPIVAGNALIFSGHFLTKERLEEAGFVFEYPWSNNYTNFNGDLDRIEQMLHTINQICEMKFSDIFNGIKQSCEYNHQYIQSQALVQHVDDINNTGLATLEKLL